MLDIKQLSKRFPGSTDGPLFAEVSLALSPGECVAVMGESGVGKSTLLNCIAGLEPIDGGRMILDGVDLGALDEDDFARLRRRKFGFVFQAFHILPHLTLCQNVALPLWLLDVAADEAARRAQAMLDQVGLGARAADWPRHLSGGELQRVAIARAIVHRPSLVLADEPTGNLDPERAADVLDLLLGCVREAGAIGILVTHSQTAAARTDRVLRLTRSGLIESGSGGAGMAGGGLSQDGSNGIEASGKGSRGDGRTAHGPSTSDTPTSDTPTSDTPTSDTPTSDTPTSDTPTGDRPTGDTPTGDRSTNGTLTGGLASR